jgi:hypothetical protein
MAAASGCTARRPTPFRAPPRASDGCVVLANQDLDVVAKNLQVGLTPVIISNSVEWLSLDDWNKERNELNKAIESLARRLGKPRHRTLSEALFETLPVR